VPEPPAAAHLVVRGHVQGVFFRAEVRERAESLGLKGWVRNNPDGTVEALLEGPRERIESVVTWARRGPRGAVVDEVEVEWVEPSGRNAFEVL